MTGPLDCQSRNGFAATTGRPTVSERGGSNARLSLTEKGEIIRGEVPGQSHRGQNGHHEHEKDVALIRDDQVLA